MHCKITDAPQLYRSRWIPIATAAVVWLWAQLQPLILRIPKRAVSLLLAQMAQAYYNSTSVQHCTYWHSTVVPVNCTSNYKHIYTYSVIRILIFGYVRMYSASVYTYVCCICMLCIYIYTYMFCTYSYTYTYKHIYLLSHECLALFIVLPYRKWYASCSWTS